MQAIWRRQATVQAAGLDPARPGVSVCARARRREALGDARGGLTDGRTARATFQKAEVPEGKVRLVTLLEKGTPIRIISKVLDRPLSPPWLGDRTESPMRFRRRGRRSVRGKQARAGARGSAVSVRPWGRDYRFEGGPLPRPGDGERRLGARRTNHAARVTRRPRRCPGAMRGRRSRRGAPAAVI